jgi:hypothetical protein
MTEYEFADPTQEEQSERLYTEAEVHNLMQQFTWEAVKNDTDPRHIFDDSGLCIRCGCDAEEQGMDCVEGLINYWEGEVKKLKQQLRLAQIDNEDLQDRNKHLINMAKGR